MSFEVDTATFKWLITTKAITPADMKQTSNTTFQIKDNAASQFQNGLRIAQIVVQLYKKRGLPIPPTLNHLKQSNNTAAQLYNWNILNDSLKKVGFEIDSQTKNLIINGDRLHLAMILRKIKNLFENNDIQDSLQTQQFQRKMDKTNSQNTMKQSLTLSRSQEPPKFTSRKPGAITSNIDELRKYDSKQSMAKGDLLQFVVNELTQNLKLSKKQAVALLSDNNKYLAHVFVKGVKGQFQDIEQLMQRFYSEIDYIVEKMIQQNDMCFYFLQIIKPALLSKSQQIAQWGCRILTKIAHELAIKQMLPLAYDWFVQEAGGLSTTILALSRHPKLNENVVGYILQFGRYNVTELFTIQLKKITKNDNLAYVKFMLLIFNPLVSSKISAEQLLQSGAIDYWIQITLKGAEAEPKNSKQLRMYCIQFLIKIWRAYPAHIQQTLDHVNNIMNQIKRGIRDDSQIMRFSLMEMMFDLLNQFANKKNPYASIVYKKITFLFIENHEQLTMRQFILRNLQQIFEAYQSIPVDIFLQPFIKQIKISESKSYVVNIFDMQFINIAVRHKKLKVGVGLELFDLLAKTKLNSYSFSEFATNAMEVLINRFIHEDIFLQYTVKLVKISLAMFYSTLKHKKQYQDQERLQAQKRAEIVNFVISLIQRGNTELNQQIKDLVVHVKVQIINRLGIQHRGIQRILGFFTDVDQAVMQAMRNVQDDLTSNATSTKSRGQFHLPKIEPRNMLLRDQTASQQSMRSNDTRYSKQQFPIKDYTEFASDDQKKFLKENGLGIKKRNMSKKRNFNSTEKQGIDPKIQQHITKIKQRKEQEQKKKMRQKEHLQRKKQMLKRKIQKQLQQRNVKQGLAGNQKDVEVKVIFQQNEISQNILDQDDVIKDIDMDEQQNRDQQSIKLVLKRYAPFVKKIFNRYTTIRGGKKDFFDGQGNNMNQVDLIRLCKQKNIQRSKNAIVELMRQANNKNTTNISLQPFFKFLELLCVEVYIKQKCSPKIIMGDLMKKILRRMSQGQNFKLDEDDDQACNNWSQKIRYNPHIDLPQNFKKIYERVYKVSQDYGYHAKRAVNEKYLVCHEVLNQILKDCFKFNIVQEQVKFMDQARVVHKKQYYLPPKPLKKQENQTSVPLLQEKQIADAPKVKRPLNKSISKRNDHHQKQNEHSKSRGKILNAAEKRKIQQQQQQRKKKEKQEQLRKQRALEVKRKLQKQQQDREQQKQKKKAQKKQQMQKQQQRIKKQKQRKQKYQKQQKQKLQKYKKQQQEKQKEEKAKTQVQKQKQDEQRKVKMKEQMKKQEQRRKQEYEKLKKQRQLSEQKKQKKKQQQEKKKQQLKKQMMKKIQGQKQKLEINKLSKQVMQKIYKESEVTQLTNNKYKDQLKAIFNYGKQHNQFTLDKANNNVIGAKGWLHLCQQLGFCDVATANKILKVHLKEKNINDFSQDDMQYALFEIAAKKEVQSGLEDYDKAKKSCAEKYDKFLANLKLPKGNQKLKDYFINLKNQVSKKKEQMSITGPNGQNQVWQMDN